MIHRLTRGLVEQRVVERVRRIHASAVQFNVLQELNPNIPGKGQLIETIPFKCSAGEFLTIARSLAIIRSDKWKAIKYLFKTGLGRSPDPKFELLKWSAVLYPSWKIDLSVIGPVIIKGQTANYRFSTTDCDFILPGNNYKPLDRLSLRIEDETAFEPISSKHLKQLGNEVTPIPFDCVPINLVHSVLMAPKVRTELLELDPSKINTDVFALYPIYLPLYLAECMTSDGAVTVVQSGQSENPAKNPVQNYMIYSAESGWIQESTFQKFRFTITPEVPNLEDTFQDFFHDNWVQYVGGRLEKLFTPKPVTPATIQKQFSNRHIMRLTEWTKENKNYASRKSLHKALGDSKTQKSVLEKIEMKHLNARNLEYLNKKLLEKKPKWMK